MKIIKRNEFMVTILAIAIVMLFLGSVSAADETVDANLTVNDNSNIEITNIDDTSQGSVDVSNEKEVLKSSDTPELMDKATCSTDVTVAAGSEVTIQANMQYDYSWYLQMSTDGSTYSTVKTDTGHAYWYDLYTFTPESGTYYFKLVNTNDRYGSPSGILKYTVKSSEETQTSISITPTTVAPKSEITITPTVYKKDTTESIQSGIVEFFYGDGISMGTIDLSSHSTFTYSGFESENTYSIYAFYKGTDDYDNSTSESVLVLVSEDTSKTPVYITLTLNNTALAPGESIAITPIVKNNNGENVSGTINLRGENDELIASNIAIASPYVYQVSEQSGDYQIYAEYLGDETLSYASGNSTKYSYKVKKQLTINLTVDGETSFIAQVATQTYDYSAGGYVYKPQYIFYANTTLTPRTVKVYDNNEEVSGQFTTDSEDISLYFESSETGDHVVYVEFEGDDEYLPAKSNNVTFTVYNAGSVSGSLSFNQSSAVVGDKILITTRVYDSSSYPSVDLTTGNITLYSDSSRTQEIATINVGETYEYTVPELTSSSSYSTVYVYATFNGATENYKIYGSKDFSNSFYDLKQNKLNITGNDEKDTIAINFGETVTLKAVIDYIGSPSYKYENGAYVYYSGIKISFDEDDEWGEFKSTSGGTIQDFEITFGDEGDLGTHTIYAYYEGSSYYASATSNILTINVVEPSKDTTISLTPTEITAKHGESNTITANVTAEGVSVSEGNITYYRNGTAIDGYTNVSVTTVFNTNTLAVGVYNITAKFEGAEGFNPSDFSNSVIVTVEEVQTTSSGTFTDLASLIESAGESLVLPYDFTYDESHDTGIPKDGVLVSKDITIYGNGSVIDGKGLHRIFDVYKANVILNGVTLINGNSNTAQDNSGGAVIVSNKITNLTIINSTIKNSVSKEGGAIQVMSGSLKVINCTFINNSATSGGAIYSTTTNAPITIDNSTFENNKASSGGSVYITSGSLVVNNSIFENNNAGNGGAITIINFASSLRVSSSRFNKNSAGEGAGIYVTSSASVNIDESNFTNNNASSQGAGVYIQNKNVKAVISNVLFTENYAKEGGALVNKLAALTVNKTSFIKNNASSNGGAIYASGSVSVSDSYLIDNTAGSAYNIYQTSENVVSLKNTVLSIIQPTVNLNESYNQGVDVVVDGTFDSGIYNQAFTVKYTFDSNESSVNIAKNKNTFSVDLGSNLEVSSHNFTIKSFSDKSGNTYNLSAVEKIFTVSVEKSDEVTISVDNQTYPDNATAVITGNPGNYTINISGRDKSFKVTIPEGETQVAQDLGLLDAGNYTVVVENTNANYTFTILKANANLVVTVNGNNTLVGETKNITVSASGEGKFTINDNTTEHALSDVIDLTDLSENATYTIHYKSTNYYSEDISVFVSILTSYTTTISIELNNNSINKGDTIIITPNVYDQNINEVKEGQVEFYDGENLIGTISLKTNSTFEYKPNQSGSVYAKYLKNDTLKLSNSTSEAKAFTVTTPEITTTITLHLSSDELYEGKNITITPIVKDSEGNNVGVGNVTIYTDYSMYYSIGTVNVGESINYTTDNTNVYENYFFYAKYNGGEDENTKYTSSQTASGTRYYHLWANTLNLTANGKKEITVYQGQSINITATTKGDGAITLFINGDENTTLTKDVAETIILSEIKDYNFTASYTRGTNDYYASCDSEKVVVHVVNAPEISVKIDLNSTSLSKNTNLTVTVNVTDKGSEVSEGIVELYNAGNVKIGEVNLSNSNTFKFNVEDAAGSYKIYAKYNDIVSENKTYVVKDNLTITLERSGTGLVKVGGSVTFTITYSASISDNLQLCVNDKNISDEDGSASTTITFDENDVGQNNITIRFGGNDYYEAYTSNIVSVNVVKPVSTNVTISLSSQEVLSGKNITITPKVLDGEGKEINVGVVKIYNTQYYTSQDPLITINAGESANYTDTKSNAGTTHYLYALYTGYTGDNEIYEQSSISAGVPYTVLYSNTLTLTVNSKDEDKIYDGGNVSVIASLTGGNGVITLYINGVENTTLTNGVAKIITLSDIKDYNFTASYTRNTSDYYASCKSSNVTVHVVEKPDVMVNIKLDETSLSKNTNLTVTVNVTNKGSEVSEGIVKIFNENNAEITQVNLSESKTFKLDVGDTAGSHVIYAKYDDYLSENQTYIVKDTLTITLERTGSGLVKVDESVTFTITYSKEISENIELLVNNIKIGDEDGASTTTITFNESDIGQNNITVRFGGNDYYEAYTSNIVSVNVVKPVVTNVTLILSSDEVFSSKNFTITAKVFDENGTEISVGNVKIYNDMNYYTKDPIATVTAGGSVNYADSTNNMGTIQFLYGIYEGYTGDDVIYDKSPLSKSVNYTIMGETRLILTANGFTETSIIEGNNITIKASLSGGNGQITLFINGLENTTLKDGDEVIFTLKNGTYIFTANYTRGSDYYVSAVSNEVKVTVYESTATNNIIVSVSDVTLPDDVVITVTATIDGIYSVDVNGTIVNVTVSGGSGNKTITLPEGEYYANTTYDGKSSITNATFKVSQAVVEPISVVLNSTNVKVVNGTQPTVTVVLPDNATGTITVTVNNKNYTAALNNATATISITGLSANVYSALITYSGDANYSKASFTTLINVESSQTQVVVVTPTKTATKIVASKKTFKVKKSKKYTVTLKTKAGKAVKKVKVYIKVKGKTYSAKTNSKGKATFNLKKLTKKGKYTAKITFKGNSKYTASSKSVKLTVKK